MEGGKETKCEESWIQTGDATARFEPRLQEDSTLPPAHGAAASETFG